jgi:hypothetical protein
MRYFLHFFGFHTYKDDNTNSPYHYCKCKYCEKSTYWNESIQGRLLLWLATKNGDKLEE